MNGTETERNIKAIEVFKKIIEECVWINIHLINPNFRIFEIRNLNGYGLRFNLPDLDFRGLIEPEENFNKNKDCNKDCN